MKRFDQDSEVEGFQRYRKTKPAHAVRVDEEFEVSTKEGVMQGKAGDYLMKGAAGELYVCDAEIFEDTYKLDGMMSPVATAMHGMLQEAEFIANNVLNASDQAFEVFDRMNSGSSDPFNQTPLQNRAARVYRDRNPKSDEAS